MPIANFDAYNALLRRERSADFSLGNTSFSSAGRLSFLSRFFVPTAPTPTTSVALDRTSDHSAQPMPIAGSGTLSLLGARISTGNNLNNNAAPIGAFLLVDLLNISGGMDATLTTTQTTNLPGGSTAALTRYTSGEGVMAALVIWITIGGTSTTFTASYTNQAGTSLRTTQPAVIGSPNSAAGRIAVFPLASGDTGVRSVQSVTLAGTTSTAGNFGVCLFKPLAMLAAHSFSDTANIFDAVSTGGFVGALNSVNPNACLSVFGVAGSASTTNQTAVGSIILDEV